MLEFYVPATTMVIRRRDIGLCSPKSRKKGDLSYYKTSSLTIASLRLRLLFKSHLEFVMACWGDKITHSYIDIFSAAPGGLCLT